MNPTHTLLWALLQGAPIQTAHAQDAAETAEDTEADPLPLVVPPELVDFVQAPYPPEAEAAGVEGSVGLLVEIDETGAVSKVEVLRPAGNGFDEAAVEAARQFQFTPAATAEGPVPVQVEFDYGFVLEADPETAVPPPATEAEADLPVRLTGTLKEMGTRIPLGNFTVTATAADGTTASADTDANGRFALRGLSPGKAKLKFAAPGYRDSTADVEIESDEVVDFTMWAKNLSYRDNEVVIVYKRQREPEITRRTLSVEEIKRVPGTFGDPVRVIQNLPGAARGPFGTGLLVIRGANPEDSNVYVDGIEVPLIYHLGGYRSVLNADMISSVDYLPGGYQVRYGQSTGGVIDVRTSDEYPDRTEVTWRTDFLDSGFHVATKLGKEDNIGFRAAARRSYIDVFIPLFAPDNGFFIKPRWYDYQTKFSTLKKGRTRLTGFIFGFQDLLFLQTPDDFAQGEDQDTQGDLSATYQTHRMMLRLDHKFNETLSLMIQPTMGIDTIGVGLGSSFALNNDFTVFTNRAELTWTFHETATAIFGMDSTATRYVIDFTVPFVPTADGGDPTSEREDFSTTIKGWFLTPDPFIDLRWRPINGTDKLLVNPGIRLNTFRVQNSPLLLGPDPRLAVRYQITETTAMKGGTGLYQQPPQGQEFGLDEDNLTVNLERSWASEVGFEQKFGQAGSVDWTGFYKRLDRLIVTNPDFADEDDDPFYVNEGVGQIYGMEFMARRALVDRWFGWVSYTLSKSERNDYPTRTADEGDVWYNYDFDQTHILTVLGGYRLPFDFEFSGRFQYVTGNPYTPFAGGIFDMDSRQYILFPEADRNTGRLPPYQALDLRVDKLFTFKSWQLELFADFLNVYRGENPEQLQYNYDGTDFEYVSGLPFIPSLGFQVDITF
ncbi:MAG TPA: hypothetical protein DFR83_20800 [Deltaproteobacteria bacterium]|nr:hypothetical protein [Deltaproteobacteria bacterium]